ncbi:glycosyltransferase family 39 protein [Mycolicibacterium confluentis]|uniref:Uncharacterized protein n=1 Tax=Mycolicibacterium confluentis TaxID=28047 RepID=A0A7I7XSL6_9MYCO|nr:hypothetical protein [Mycolicibacterium confluentis]MCV7317620.1 hypothetical protein [Mycolicibacterium confluentis]ORV30818.1 hypothetical protein AWB99_12835 [Mycolicibacterium confluentis]BBZ32063.1 hypothetical protein MCNF_06680 [Mycolicibacterium confluentis]
MSPRELTSASRTALVSLGLGVAAFLLHLAASSEPGTWSDEAVTVLSVRRSLASLAESQKFHDLAHGAYYVVGHIWGSALDTDVVSIRALSALSVGVSTCLLVVLGNMLLGLRFGVYSALVFTTLPRVIWSATEARSPALVTAVVIGAMIAFLLALHRDSAGVWIGYGVLLVSSVVLFQFAALNFVALPLVVYAARPSRRVVIRFCIATSLAAVACVPFLLRTAQQLDTIDWIAESFTLKDALKAVWSTQYLTPDGVALGAQINVLLWTMALGGILLAARRAQSDPDARLTAVLTASWLILPTVFLLGYSVVATPAYTERYLASSAPALAMAVALALYYVPLPREKQWFVATVPVVLVMLLSTGAWHHYHRIWAKSGWAEAAQSVQAHKQEGDVIVAASPMHAAAVLVLPDEFSTLEVINIDVPYYADNTPWGSVTSVSEDPDQLTGRTRVWYLGTDGISEEEAAVFAAHGFKERWRQQKDQMSAILYERDSQ